MGGTRKFYREGHDCQPKNILSVFVDNLLQKKSSIYPRADNKSNFSHFRLNLNVFNASADEKQNMTSSLSNYRDNDIFTLPAPPPLLMPVLITEVQIYINV